MIEITKAEKYRITNIKAASLYSTMAPRKMKKIKSDEIINILKGKALYSNKYFSVSAPTVNIYVFITFFFFKSYNKLSHHGRDV